MRSVQFRLPAGATFEPHRGRSQQAGRGLFPARAREEERPHLLRGRRRRRRRCRARIPARPSSTSPPSTSARAAKNSADAIVQRASAAFRGLRDAQVFALVPGAIRGLGQSDRLHDGAAEHQRHEPRSSSPRRATACSPRQPPIRSWRRSGSASCPTSPASRSTSTSSALAGARPHHDRRQFSTLSTAWGGRYVNDFIDRGRVKRVYVQGDAPYRAAPSDIDHWFVRNNQGADGALLVLRADRLDDDADHAVAASSAIRRSRFRARARRA